MKNSMSLLQHGKRFVILLPLLLTACVGLIPSKGKIKPQPAALTFCTGADPIYWSKNDTDKTIAQIKEHNAVGVALKCPKWLAPPS